MRGFLGGVSVGALLAAGGLAMLSLSVPMSPPEQVTAADPADEAAPAAPRPVQQDPGAAPEKPNGGGETAEVPDGSPARDADLAEAQPVTPATAEGSDDLSALAGMDTMPADKPKIGLAEETWANGGPESAEAPSLAQGGGESLPKAMQPAVPEAPLSESAVVAATEPAPAPVESASGSEASLPEETGQAAIEPEAADSSVAWPPEVGSAPQAVTLPVISAAPALPAVTGSDSGESTEPGSESAATEPGAEPEEQEALAPRIGTPVVPLTERDNDSEVASRNGVVTENPFASFAEPFDNPEGRPLMSIVLIDDAGAVGAEALAEFPYPLSFAIDPEDPEAAVKMAARRSAGFEVLMLVDLPRSASPQEAETALEVWRGKLPEAVAFLEGVETGVQGNRPLADQVSALAATVGFGLVTQNSGLNTVQKLALRDGVPAGVVFRDFDGAGQDPRAIRRFLDQAAFRAGQEGAVIMLGRLRPDTISALLVWGLQDRAARVALAPVSASLVAKLPK
ncbi:MAG: divergent polysaccharide deacetylase family protein [Leisingera sp.]